MRRVYILKVSACLDQTTCYTQLNETEDLYNLTCRYPCFFCLFLLNILCIARIAHQGSM